MELSCPSCSSKHKTEDYPGAFEIQCACGYSILVPDENSLEAPPDADPEVLPDFDAAPMAMDQFHEDAKVPLVGKENETPIDAAVIAAQAQDEHAFSSLNLTSPENLPEEMPYDPFELENQWKSETDVAALGGGGLAPVAQDPSVPLSEDEQQLTANEVAPPPKPAPPKPVVAQDIVNRIQMASIGYMHGALFDLELENISDVQARKLAEHCTKVLEERPWMRAHLDQNLEKSEHLRKNRRLNAVPELMAVEIYLHCAQNGVPCQLISHKE